METIDVIETNIDDMNPQIYEYLTERLLENGALDAVLTSIVMKKNRPGIKLTVLSKPEDTEKLSGIIFEETTTTGVRIRQEKRKILRRKIKEVDTKYGKIRVKISLLDEKIMNISPEYEDCKYAAKKNKVPLKEVQQEAVNEFKLHPKNNPADYFLA